ncbi:MAG: GGDEF domain-containing protein [Lachnospiraceae bacterium]|nr:GGDEF domain-containing protein [Lachnospiraceae bacterium]
MRSSDLGLMFSGIDHETYENISPAIVKEERRNLLVFSVISVVMLTLLTIYALTARTASKNILVYIFLDVDMVIVFLLSKYAILKHPGLTKYLTSFFMVCYFALGIVIGTVKSGGMTAVSFFVILFIVPVIFNAKPMYSNLLILLCSVIFFLVDHKVKYGMALRYDDLNLYLFFFLAILVNTAMGRIKLQRFVFEYQLKMQSDTDVLTGLWNRRKFDAQINSMSDDFNRLDVTLISLDVNSLKKTNDAKGHAAGDELICGAADCIKDAFHPYGEVYRIGGDEFAVILHSCQLSNEELKELLTNKVDCWKGHMVDKLTISVGISSSKDENVHCFMDLSNYADKEMYRDKNYYYLQKTS